MMPFKVRSRFVGVEWPMNHGSRRIVSDERIDLIRAYEKETTFRGRAIAANNLWQSLPPHVRNELCHKQGHHCGFWLQEQLATSDEKQGRPPITPTSRNALRALLLREKGIKGRTPRDVSVVWKWLDEGELAPAQLVVMFRRVDDLMQRPGASWAECVLQAKDATKANEHKGRKIEGRKRGPGGKFEGTPPEGEQPHDAREAEQRETEAPPEKEKGPSRAPRAAVEKTLQFQALKKVLEDAPEPRGLPIPAGVDAQTYRQAYGEMLENVRVVLDIAGRDFTNAKRRYRSTEISLKAGALAKACRTLRVSVPPPGEPVDEFSSRRKWLEIVKAYHPDRIAGDTSKVQVFDAANKAFETIKAYNRKLADQRKETSSNVDSEHQGTDSEHQSTAKP